MARILTLRDKKYRILTFRDKKYRILTFRDKKCGILTFRDKTELYSTVLQQNMLKMWGQASLSFVISLPEGRRASQR